MIIGLYISKICQEGRSHVKCSFCNRNKNEKVSSGILYPEKKKKAKHQVESEIKTSREKRWGSAWQRVPNYMKYLRKFFQQKTNDIDESSIGTKTLTVPEMDLGCSTQDLWS